RYYVDGGFAQVEGDVVNILTARSIPVDLLKSEEAVKALEDAQAMPSSSPEQMQLKDTAIRRARGQVRAAR
ncbi:MAG: F0F1 ATP synthase subunit epsilon, partial [Rubripirellula sp.]